MPTPKIKKEDKLKDQKEVLRTKQIIQKVSDVCDYNKYEVEDVLRAFYAIMRYELYKGNALLFEKLFRLEVIKSPPRLLYNMHTKRKYMSPGHPKLMLTPSIGLLDYIRETPETMLEVKKGVPSFRFQHHLGKNKEFYVKKTKAQKIREELPDPD